MPSPTKEVGPAGPAPAGRPQQVLEANAVAKVVVPCSREKMSQPSPCLRGGTSRAVSGACSQLHRDLARSDLRDPISKDPSMHHQDFLFKHLGALLGV